jgi:hypothetical protein
MIAPLVGVRLPAQQEQARRIENPQIALLWFGGLVKIE